VVNRWIQIILLAGIALACNVWTFEAWAKWSGLFWYFGSSRYWIDQAVATYWTLDLWLVMAIVFMVAKRMTLWQLFKRSLWFDGLTLLFGFLFLLATNPILAGYFQWIRVGVPILLLFLLAKVLHLGFIQAPVHPRALKWRSVATAVASVLTVILVLEGVFMFIAQPNLNNNALASKVWFGRYWDSNGSGYREKEEPWPGKTTKPHIVWVGDSFLAGHGVKDTADRFSNLIGTRLESEWWSHNQGVNGASAADMRSTIVDNWFQSELIVYCWFVNDIQGAAYNKGVHSPGYYLKQPFPFSIVHGSYFFNYLYHLFPDPKAGKAYLQYLGEAHARPDVMLAYRQQLTDIHVAAREKGKRFAAVLFPMMNWVEGSEFAIQPVRVFWEDRGVPCLDLSSIYLPYSPEELMVNAKDAHPNEFAHQLAADAIWEWMQRERLLKSESPGQ
jgi:hypothetical protein